MEVEDAKIWLRQVVKGELCDKETRKAIVCALEVIDEYEAELNEREERKMIKNKKAFDEVVSLLMMGQQIDGFESEGYKLSENKEHVKLIVEGLRKKERFCPCRVQKTEENICCCTDFIENGHCCCKLWEKVGEENA